MFFAAEQRAAAVMLRSKPAAVPVPPVPVPSVPVRTGTACSCLQATAAGRDSGGNVYN